MPRKDPIDRMNVIGVSANPKVQKAISKAAGARKEIVREAQVLTELSELPVALERIDVSLHTLVFLDYDPVLDPELVQALQQIHSRAGNSTTFFLTKRFIERLPDEFRGDGSIGTMGSPPIEWTAFARWTAIARVIDSLTGRVC